MEKSRLTIVTQFGSKHKTKQTTYIFNGAGVMIRTFVLSVRSSWALKLTKWAFRSGLNMCNGVRGDWFQHWLLGWLVGRSGFYRIVYKDL